MQKKLEHAAIAVGTFIVIWAVSAIVIQNGANMIDKVMAGYGAKIKSLFQIV